MGQLEGPGEEEEEEEFITSGNCKGKHKRGKHETVTFT